MIIMNGVNLTTVEFHWEIFIFYFLLKFIYLLFYIKFSRNFRKFSCLWDINTFTTINSWSIRVEHPNYRPLHGLSWVSDMVALLMLHAGALIVNICIFHNDLQQNPSGYWQMEWSSLTLTLRLIQLLNITHRVYYIR